MTNRPASGPLTGVRILDFSQYLAGPLAAAKLGDLGANVIKIERIDGEGGRNAAAAGCRIGGESPTFMALNRSKRGIALNLKNAEGVAIARQLAKQSDVVIENFRPGVMSRLGLDYETLRAENPRLIYCSASGYGPVGPLAERPGQDLLAQALSGLAWNTGRAEDPPMPAGTQVADGTLANLIAFGVVVALFERERTGVGQRVEASLLSALLDLQTHELATYLNCGVPARRSGSGIGHVYLAAPYGIYRTSDSHLAIAQTPLPQLGELLGTDALAAYPNVEEAYRSREAIGAILKPLFARRTTQAWLDLLLPAGIWVGPVFDYEDLLSSGQVQANEMIATFDHPSAGPVSVAGPPVRFDGAAITRLGSAPLLGQHTTEILAELGCSPDEILRLDRDGVIGTGAARGSRTALSPS
jgi:crotonobetainyl-CoA:carnitine CoA-transferase CaiB-like acyl-CoA transferase